MGSVAGPSPLAVWRHCPDPACAVSWRTVDELCWCCGRRGQSGQLTNPTSRPYEAYTGGAPTPENPLTA
jgi:hypothetical protein